MSYDELMIPAFATAASSEASSMEGLEPREDLKEVTRLWQAPLLPTSPMASLTQSAALQEMVSLCLKLSSEAAKVIHIQLHVNSDNSLPLSWYL